MVAATIMGMKHESNRQDEDKTMNPDAHLIAAAPVLLEALEGTLDWLTSYPGHGADTAYDRARAAIAAAKGETS